MKFVLPKFILREFELRRVFVLGVRDFKLNQFHDTGFVVHNPGNDLPGVFTVFCFGDGLGTVNTILAAPFKLSRKPANAISLIALSQSSEV